MDKVFFKSKKNKFLGKFKERYRLILRKSSSLEETFNFELKPLNVFVIAGAVVIGLIILTTLLIAFTPLREYIPGYKDPNLDRRLHELSLRVDSLYVASEVKDRYLYVLQSIYQGDNIELVKQAPTIDSVDYSLIKDVRSKNDSIFRREIEAIDHDVVDANPNGRRIYNNGVFLQPVRGGVLLDSFDGLNGKNSIEFIVKSETPVLSIADGTVIYTGWTMESGYVMVVMHRNNFSSVYRNNSVLLKNIGDYVKAGDVISIVGDRSNSKNSGKLYFELWNNGVAVNPADFIKIE